MGRRRQQQLQLPTSGDLNVLAADVLFRGAKHAGSVECPAGLLDRVRSMASALDFFASGSPDLLDGAAEIVRLAHRHEVFAGRARLGFIVGVLNEFLEDNGAFLDADEHELERLNVPSFARPERKPELVGLLRVMILGASDDTSWSSPPAAPTARRAVVIADADPDDQRAHEQAVDDAITVCAAFNAASWTVDCPLLQDRSREARRDDLAERIREGFDLADAVVIIRGTPSTLVAAGAVPPGVPLLFVSRSTESTDRPWMLAPEAFAFYFGSSQLRELVDQMISRHQALPNVRDGLGRLAAETDQLSAELRVARLEGSFRVPPGMTVRRIERMLSTPRHFANARNWERVSLVEAVGAAVEELSDLEPEDPQISDNGQLELGLGLGVSSPSVRRTLEPDASTLHMNELTAQLASADFDWESTEWLTDDELRALRTAALDWPTGRAEVMYRWAGAVRALEYVRSTGSSSRRPVRLRKTNLNHKLDWSRHYRTVFREEASDE